MCVSSRKEEEKKHTNKFSWVKGGYIGCWKWKVYEKGGDVKERERESKSKGER